MTFFTKALKKISSDRFLANTFVFSIGSLVVSAGNYLFQLFIVRKLSIPEYGEVQALLSVSAIFGIPLAGFSIVAMRYSARFWALGEKEKLAALFLFFSKIVILIGGSFLLVFLLLSPWLADFLNLKTLFPLIILGSGLLPGFLGSLNRGIIQGLERFRFLSLISVLAVTAKLILVFLFIEWGWAVAGVIGVIALITLFGCLLSFWPLAFLIKEIKKGVKISLETKEILGYFLPVFGACLGLNLFSNIDMVLVKHFFSDVRAGEYGGLVLSARVLLYAIGPIEGVMFPMVAALSARKKDPLIILKKSLFLTAVLGIGTLLVYFLFPGFVIKTIVGESLLAWRPLLGWLGLGVLLFGLAQLFTQYFLSLGEGKTLLILGPGIILQTAMIFWWHTHLAQIVAATIAGTTLTLTLFIVYYFFSNLRGTKKPTSGVILTSAFKLI